MALLDSLPLCEPGINQRQPFSSVQSSSANQNPTADKGSVYKKEESWWEGTMHNYKQKKIKKLLLFVYLDHQYKVV